MAGGLPPPAVTNAMAVAGTEAQQRDQGVQTQAYKKRDRLQLRLLQWVAERGDAVYRGFRY